MPAKMITPASRSASIVGRVIEFTQAPTNAKISALNNTGRVKLQSMLPRRWNIAVARTPVKMNVNNAVAISLLLTGFFLMIIRRKAITQVLALLTMENGVMLAAIALTTYGMPLVVEIGIFFDVVVAVMVLGILVFRIRETFASMDVSKLNELKW